MALTEEKLLTLLNRYVSKHKTKQDAARALAISAPYLSDILSGRRPVPDSVLSAIQVKRVVTYRKEKTAA